MDAWKQWSPSCPVDWQMRPPEAGVEAVRRELLAALDDCHGTDCDRLRWRLHTAERAQELWLLRDQILEAVAHQHCLALARERIDGLLAAFGTAATGGLGERVQAPGSFS
ncbi:hypothetical protein GCM10028796_43050 [Ramlibacter monticola]|uniref:Uncharacterized protein n=1 Tax=Ramlibacter monticola TaxID=1926872 RepID=A0A936Z107_9BURK|nr:hypothetical protein [Ramlibacter monticola]MBL0392904.1 hypothetical protein [Ramlibacter monticola]